jgi:hypothetical protein
VRASFPHRKFDAVDHAGLTWTNVPVGVLRPYAAVQISQGWEPPTKQIALRAIPFLPQQVPFIVWKSNGQGDAIRFIERVSNYVAASETTAPTTRGEIRWLTSGQIDFVVNNEIVASLVPPAEGAPEGSEAFRFPTYRPTRPPPNLEGLACPLKKGQAPL